MVTKILKIAGVIFLLLNLWACPFDRFCKSPQFEIPDLISVVPVDTVYHVGDEIIYTAVIPSRIDSLNIDIYENTGVTSTMIGVSEFYKFDGNVIDVIKGFTRRLDDNILAAYVSYNPTDKVYEFQAKITFTRLGEYSIYPDGMRMVFTSDDSHCPGYEIKTNIRGFQIHSGEMWEFRVVP